jgi:CheY-like chemotaxis protein
LPLVTGQVSQDEIEPTESDTQYSQLAGLKILVVDDEPDTLELTTMILEEYDAIVTAVASVENALQALASERFEVLISDISMPEADGYDLIQSVRETDQNLIIIALTAYASEADRAIALESGFDHYLAKPIDADELLNTVESFIQAKATAIPKPRESSDRSR